MLHRPLSPRLVPLAATLTAMACFQGGASIAKGLFPALGPEGTVALRTLFGALILIAVRRPWRDWPPASARLPILVLGLGMAGAVFFFYVALNHLPQGVDIALQFLGPLAVAIGGSRRAADLLWAVLAGLGVWLLIGLAPSREKIEAIGVVFALLAGASWAAYILAGRWVSRTGGADHGSALALAVGAAILLPIGLWRAGPALFAPEHLPLALAVAVLASAIPFPLELFAMSRIPARTFAVLMSLEPAMGALSGFMLLGERLSATQVMGVAAVVVAAGGATWTAPSENGKPALASLDIE